MPRRRIAIHGFAVALLLLAGVHRLRADFPYASYIEYAPEPRSAVSGDFDGDGHPDLAVALRQTDDVGILLAAGDGTFGPLVEVQVFDGVYEPVSRVPAGTDPEWIVGGHLNGDAHLDLVVVNNGSSDVTVLLGGAGGTFTPQSPVSTGDQPVAATLALLNADGFPDLLVSNTGSQDLSFYPGIGDGTFGTEVRIPLGGITPGHLAVGTFNADAFIDVVTADLLLPGNGDGTFGTTVPVPVSCCVQSLVAGDFDDDGALDLAAALSEDRVEILDGDGAGSFSFGASYMLGGGSSAAPTHIASHDLDGDLDLDLAVTSQGKVHVLLGEGDGTFVLQGALPGRGESSFVTMDDVDQDGSVDLLVLNTSDFGPAGDVQVLHGNGDGSFQTQVEEPSESAGNWGTDLVAADFDLDGHQDLIVASSDPPVHYGVGDGSLEPPVPLVPPGSFGRTYRPTAADLDGNGIPDVVLWSQEGIAVVLGLGGRTFAPPVTYPFPALSNAKGMIAVGDFDADGDQDVAVATVNSEVQIRLGNGDGTLQPAMSYLTRRSVTAVVVTDLQGDGSQDVVAAGSADIAVLMGRGDGTFDSATFTPSLDLRLYGAVLNDLDGDGVDDLAFGSTHAELVPVHRGQPDGSFLPAEPLPNFFGPLGLATGDLNRDGLEDLVTASWQTGMGQATVFLGEGGGSFARGVQVGAGFWPTAVVPTDLNEDGALDLAVGNWYGVSVSLIMNRQGGGTCLDADGDGFGRLGDPTCAGGLVRDCDDTNAMVYPGAVEVCDQVDNDCDLRVDEGLDLDGDGVTPCNGDCDDGDTTVHRFAVENCADGKDNDCDGNIDDAISFFVGTPSLSVRELSLEWVNLGFDVARVYDVVKGDLAALRSSGGDFSAAVTACLADGVIHTSMDHGAVPAPGSVDWFLVRGGNCNNDGTYDSGGSSSHAPRDAGILAAASACP